MNLVRCVAANLPVWESAPMTKFQVSMKRWLRPADLSANSISTALWVFWERISRKKCAVEKQTVRLYVMHTSMFIGYMKACCTTTSQQIRYDDHKITRYRNKFWQETDPQTRAAMKSKVRTAKQKVRYAGGSGGRGASLQDPRLPARR